MMYSVSSPNRLGLRAMMLYLNATTEPSCWPVGGGLLSSTSIRRYDHGAVPRAAAPPDPRTLPPSPGAGTARHGPPSAPYVPPGTSDSTGDRCRAPCHHRATPR